MWCKRLRRYVTRLQAFQQHADARDQLREAAMASRLEPNKINHFPELSVAN